MFNINDRVTLKPARGGEIGFVSDILGGPIDVLYHVIPESAGWTSGGILSAEIDIESGILPPPVFNICDTITLYGKGGTIVDKTGDLFTVNILVPRPGKNLIFDRMHRDVPLWRIAIENSQ